MEIMKTIPRYGDFGTGDVNKLQAALKLKGFDPGASDDWFGDKTLRALKAFQKSKNLRGTGVIPADGGQTFSFLGLTFNPHRESEVPPPPKSDNFFGAPWIGVDLDLLGREESDAELNRRLVPEWKLEGLNYKTLVGNKHAWCSLRVNHALRKVGVKGTNSAGAASHSKWGVAAPFWFGATLPIKHRSGGRHVCFFLYWINEAKKLCATLDGNRSNRFAVFATDLAKADSLVPGPRWSKDVPDGQTVSMAQVLAKYPILKVGGGGSSTR